MRFPPDHEWLKCTASAPGTEVLLTGWEGTLEPDTLRPQVTSLPPEVAEMVEPWLQEAAASVRGGRGDDAEGVALRLEGMLPDLRRRLGAVFPLPVAMGRARGRSPERMVAEGLARVVVEDWVAGMLLFRERFAADCVRLAGWVGEGVLAEVEGLEAAAAAEVHGPGGSVIRIKLRGGRVIFYKPRPVTGEMLWAELNEAVAARDAGAAVRAARVLEGGRVDSFGAYGWMEGLERCGCDEDLHWRRAGSLLCLAECAGLSDLHMSNVLVTAEGPAVLDAECLGATDWDEAEGMVGTGLLPVGLPDVSGLFGGEAAVPGVLVAGWNEAGEMWLAGSRLLEQGNRPQVRRRPIECLPGMVKGYLRSQRALVEVREELLRPGGWVERVQSMHGARVVLRSTLRYGVALSRSLGMGTEGGRRLAVRKALGEAGMAREVVEGEVEALLRMWVPRFLVVAGTRDLRLEGSGLVVRGAVPRCAADGIGRRLEALPVERDDEGVGSRIAAALFRAPSGSF